MCGIAGHAGVLDDRVGAALDRLAYRGPDGAGSVALDGFVLACRRLAITDRSADQPLVAGAAGARAAIVMNGSLRGPERLRDELRRLGVRVATANDAELPLALYRAQGVAGLRELDGQFAFAIFDEARGCLVLGRDRFGEKPLFVAHGHGAAFPAFASSPAALRALGRAAPASMTAEAAARFARHGWLDLDGAGRGARAFPRGTVRRHDRDGTISESRLAMPDPGGGGEASLARLARDAVAARTHGDRRLGVFLSGGLDSSLIAWLAREAGRKPLCVTLDFAEQPGESARAARIAAHLGLPHERTTAGPEALDALPGLVERAGVPLGDPSVLAVFALAAFAAARGAGIVLSGEGGDELFLGYRRQRAFAWTEQARSLLPGPWLRAAASLARGTRPLARLLRAGASGDYADLLAVADGRDVNRLFGHDGTLASETPAPSRLPAEPAAALARARDLDVAGYLAWDLCPKLDVASLAAGIEARSPLLDARLLAWARLHASTHEASGKRPLQALLAGVLPARLRGGRKRGFAPPIGSWLVRRSWVRDVLAGSRAPFDRDLAVCWYDGLPRAPGRAHLVFNLLSLSLHAESWRG